MKTRLTVFRVILAVLLTTTIMTGGLEMICVLKRPTVLLGHGFDIMIIVLAMIPVLYMELDLYFIVKYFFANTTRTKGKTVCKTLSFLCITPVIIMGVKVLCDKGSPIYFYICWQLAILLVIVHVVEFVLDKKELKEATLLQEWIAESKSKE